MCLARWAKFRFHTQMKLDASGLKPGAAAFCQLGRLWDFSKPQKISVEHTRFPLFTGRHGDLNMVDGENFHVG